MLPTFTSHFSTSNATFDSSADSTLRILIIDHYDSYTNNILQLLEGCRERGRTWEPVIIQYNQYQWEFFVASILPSFHAIIISPGPGSPERVSDFGFNARLIRDADIPILGICLGHQGIATSFGARIMHAPSIKHGQISPITHDGTGVLEGLPQNFQAVRYNSLVIDPTSLSNDIIATAWTSDKEAPNLQVLMGIRHATKPVFGVQWHPESICSSYGRQIISNFRSIVQTFWSEKATLEIDRSRNLSRAWFPCAKKYTENRIIISNHQRNGLRYEADDLTPYSIKRIELGPGPSCEFVFDHIVRDSSKDGDAWLDSAKTMSHSSQYSFLATGTFSISYSTRDRRVIISQDGQELKSISVIDSFWSWMDDFQKEIQNSVENDSHIGAQHASLQVGFIGHFGYELKRESLPGYQGPPRNRQKATEHRPDTRLIFASTVLRYDHVTQSWSLFSLVRNSTSDPIGEKIGARHTVGLSAVQIESYAKYLKARFASPNMYNSTKPSAIPQFISQDSRESYKKAIGIAKEAIRNGDSYEMTLTTKFKKTTLADPFAMYLTLRRKNPAPYSAYMHFPDSKTSILSSSPEKFISIDRHGNAEMKPIKGTVAVSADPEEDARRRAFLANDVKELAENLMIVDLIRSDLHNIAPPETIQVPKLLHVESYQTVHQLVTTIQARVSPSVGSVKALQSIFPPGSMTGAPKLRSVQILDELEKGDERGAYSGCLGYICVTGAMDQSVVIRTIVKIDDELELRAGGAITWLSDPDKEWDEVLVKASAVAQVKVE